jgi:TFIIF-interacting CTD phosphatase-like protein
MDETLVHASTLVDIYENKIYGEDNVHPTFVTSFEDSDQTIEIGVFVRPNCIEVLQALSFSFELCIFTAST